MIRHLTKNNEAFSLMELMLGTLVLVIALVSISVAYVSCFELNETSRNTTLFINAAQKEMEEIKNTAFSAITSYSFSPDYLTGNSIGIVNVDNTDPQLLEVTVTICWRQKSGRIVGEDTNLNGVINVGEDSNGSGILDSPVQLITLISE